MSLPKFNLSKLRESVLKQQSVTKRDIASLLLLDRLQAQIRREKTEESKIKEDKIPYGKVVLVLNLKETSNKDEYMVLFHKSGHAGERFSTHSYANYESDLLSNIAMSECIGESDESFTRFIGGDIYTFFNESFHFSIARQYKTEDKNLEIIFVSEDTIFKNLEEMGVSDYEGKNEKLKNDVVSFFTNTIKKAFGIHEGSMDDYDEVCDELDIPKNLRLKSLSLTQIPCIIGLDLLSVEAYMGTNPDIN